MNPALLLALSLCLFFGNAFAVKPILPPANHRGTLADLEQQQFFEETITSFNGWDTPFDGGSRVFFFATASDLRFYIVAASQHHWNEEDKQTMLQPYFIVLKKFYRIEPKSPEEEKLLAMLEKALPTLEGKERRNPQIIRTLIEHIRSRKPVVPLTP